MVRKANRVERGNPLVPTSGIRAGKNDQRRRVNETSKRRMKIANVINSFKQIVLETEAKIKKPPKCYTCKKKGHTYRNCPVKPSTSEGRTSGIPINNNPENQYHAKYQEKIQLEGDYLINGTDFGDWNHIWYLSTTYEKHMAYNHDVFVKFRTCFAVDTRQEIDNFLFTHGIGEARIDTMNGPFIIPCVSYTPECNINVLSLKQLREQGFIVKFDGATCTIHDMFEEIDEEETSEDVMKKKDEFLNEYYQELDASIEPTTVLDIPHEEMYTKFEPDEKLEVSENSFKGFVRFMDIVNQKTIKRDKIKEFRECFANMMKWFHQSFTEGGVPKEIPPTLVGHEIDLYEMYKLIKGNGGYEKVTRKDLWGEIAMSFGYPEVYEGHVKQIYVRYLLIPDSYYTVAKETTTMADSIMCDDEPSKSNSYGTDLGTEQMQTAVADLKVGKMADMVKNGVMAETMAGVKVTESVETEMMATKEEITKETDWDMVDEWKAEDKAKSGDKECGSSHTYKE